MHRRVSTSWSIAWIWLAACALACGCSDDGATDDDESDAAVRHSKLRTVDIELWKTVDRAVEEAEDGSFRFGKRTDLAGVKICAAQARPAFASFEPFTPLEDPICATSEIGQSVQLNGLPANSDFLFTYEKDGYVPMLGTFRTDEFDSAVPWWSDSSVYFTAMVREDAIDPWVERAELDEEHGVIAAWVQAVGVFEEGSGNEQLISAQVDGVTPADGAEIAIELGGQLITETESLRDRPRFIALPEGNYRVRFSHPVMEIIPVGVQEQYLTTGLPIDDFESIEVPVSSGYLSLALVDGYCPLPAEAVPEFSDLATCTLAKSQAEP